MLERASESTARQTAHRVYQDLHLGRASAVLGRLGSRDRAGNQGQTVQLGGLWREQALVPQVLMAWSALHRYR